MHNHDEKYPARPGFEPGTSMLQAPVDTYESSGPVVVLPCTSIVPIISPCTLSRVVCLITLCTVES